MNEVRELSIDELNQVSGGMSHRPEGPILTTVPTTPPTFPVPIEQTTIA